MDSATNTVRRQNACQNQADGRYIANTGANRQRNSSFSNASAAMAAAELVSFTILPSDAMTSRRRRTAPHSAGQLSSSKSTSAADASEGDAERATAGTKAAEAGATARGEEGATVSPKFLACSSLALSAMIYCAPCTLSALNHSVHAMANGNPTTKPTSARTTRTHVRAYSAEPQRIDGWLKTTSVPPTSTQRR